MLKRILLILIAHLFYLSPKAQTYSISELNKITSDYIKEDKYQKIVEVNREALKDFLATENEEGAFLAYINIANFLSAQNKYKESLDNLKKADAYAESSKNPELLSKYYGGYGNNFSNLGMLELSNNYFDKSIKAAKSIKDQQKNIERQYIGYTWKLANFKDLHQLDSLKSMERKCLTLKPNPYLYGVIARRFLEEEKNLDSAKFYLDKASSIVNNFPLSDKAVILEYYAILYAEKKNYQLAVDYNLQALEIYKKLKLKKGLRDVYKFLSENYEILNEKDKANFYLKNYSLISDSIRDEEKANLNIPIKKIEQENKNSQKLLSNNSKKIILGLIIFLFVIIIYSIRRQRRKEEIIKNTSVKNKVLESKLNIAFNEVVELAKKSDPIFLTRFNEVYPDFYLKLTSEYPSLTNKEVKLCALLKLNFSTKEIADYENVALRTIETRRYTIRQKLKLSSNENLNLWLNKLK